MLVHSPLAPVQGSLAEGCHRGKAADFKADRMQREKGGAGKENGPFQVMPAVTYESSSNWFLPP